MKFLFQSSIVKTIPFLFFLLMIQDMLRLLKKVLLKNWIELHEKMFKNKIAYVLFFISDLKTIPFLFFLLMIQDMLRLLKKVLLKNWIELHEKMFKNKIAYVLFFISKIVMSKCNVQWLQGQVMKQIWFVLI